MMKTKITISILTIMLSVIFSSLEISAQEDGDFQTLISRDKHFSRGAYAGFEFGYTPVAGRSAFLTGFNAAWVVDHTLELGIVAKGFVTNPLPDMLLDNQNYLYTGGYGGIHIAANIMGEKPINVSFPLLIGAGAISYIRTGNITYYEDFYPESHYAYFVIEPGVELQLNMTRFFRISAGVSYRYTSDVYLLYSDTNADAIGDPSILRGLNASVKFKFGKF